MSSNECGHVTGTGPAEGTRLVCILPPGHAGQHGTLWERTAVVERLIASDDSASPCVTATFREELLPRCPYVWVEPDSDGRHRCVLAEGHAEAGHANHRLEYVPPDLLREQDEPPEEWEPSEEHVALAATLVACHGGVLVVGKHELVYLAADGMGYAKRLRVMPFGDGTVSIEVDDG